MDIRDFQTKIERRLTSELGIINYVHPIVQKTIGNRAVMRTVLQYYDGSEFHYRVLVDTEKCYPNYGQYSYQYVRGTRKLFRYDNANHYPSLPNYPHHKHIRKGSEEIVLANEEDKEPSLSKVFKEIQFIISSGKSNGRESNSDDFKKNNFGILIRKDADL